MRLYHRLYARDTPAGLRRGLKASAIKPQFSPLGIAHDRGEQDAQLLVHLGEEMALGLVDLLGLLLKPQQLVFGHEPFGNVVQNNEVPRRPVVMTVQ